jgi:hypothetical protein
VPVTCIIVVDIDSEGIFEFVFFTQNKKKKLNGVLV